MTFIVLIVYLMSVPVNAVIIGTTDRCSCLQLLGYTVIVDS